MLRFPHPVVLLGGAWVVVDRLGTLPAVVSALVEAFAGRGLWVVPIVALFFGAMGALENMQEEIIPLVPALMVLGAGIGVDGVVVVAMSAGAAMVGSAFGPTNPFQAVIALKLAQLPPLAGGGVRLVMFLVGLSVWIAWTLHYARGAPCGRRVVPTVDAVRDRRDPSAGAGRDRGNPRRAVTPTSRPSAAGFALDWQIWGWAGEQPGSPWRASVGQGPLAETELS